MFLRDVQDGPSFNRETSPGDTPSKKFHMNLSSKMLRSLNTVLKLKKYITFDLD